MFDCVVILCFDIQVTGT